MIRRFGISHWLVFSLGCGTGGQDQLAGQAHTVTLLSRGSTKVEVDVGMVPQGGATGRRVRLVNKTGRTLHVRNVKTTCPCVRLDAADGLLLLKNEVKELPLVVDFSLENEFVGSLAAEIQADDVAGNRAFTLAVIVDVRASHANTNPSLPAIAPVPMTTDHYESSQLVPEVPSQ